MQSFFLLALLASSASASLRVPPSNLKHVESRIINGQDAVKGRFPHLVDLDNDKGEHACMGSLIAPDVVLTAAHCRSVAIAHVGRYYHDERTSESIEKYNIIKIIKHPEYNDFTLNNDFAILQLSGASKQPIIRLNADSAVPEIFQEVTVAGFGDTNAGSEVNLPNVLQEVTVQVVSNDACSRVKTRGGLTLLGMIGPVELCAFRQNQDACQGDSGAPLIIKGDSVDDDVQVGVVSYGLGCGSSYIPGIYARVSHEFEWIREYICDKSIDPPSYFDCEEFRQSGGGGGTAISTRTASVVNDPVVPDDPILLNIAIEFDDNARDNGYFLEKVNGLYVSPVSKILPGSFTFTRSYSDFFQLERGELYSFIYFDTQEDGMSSGSVRLSLKDGIGKANLIKSFTAGSFTSGVRYFFYASPTEPENTFRDIPRFNQGRYLTLQIDFDDYPEEIGFEFKMDGKRILYHPPRYFYSYTEKTFREQISIPKSFHEYEMTISDVFGDGFSGNNGAGYSLWEGNANTGNLLMQGSFAFGYSKTWRFNTCALKSIGCDPSKAAAAAQRGNDAFTSVFTLPPDSGVVAADLSLTNASIFNGLQQNISGFNNLFSENQDVDVTGEPFPDDDSEPEIFTEYSAASRHYMSQVIMLLLCTLSAVLLVLR